MEKNHLQVISGAQNLGNGDIKKSKKVPPVKPVKFDKEGEYLVLHKARVFNGRIVEVDSEVVKMSFKDACDKFVSFKDNKGHKANLRVLKPGDVLGIVRRHKSELGTIPEGFKTDSDGFANVSFMIFKCRSNDLGRGVLMEIMKKDSEWEKKVQEIWYVTESKFNMSSELFDMTKDGNMMKESN